jgi:hypothetical protein
MFQPGYREPARDDVVFDGARAVVEEEISYIERWRGRRPVCGLALSGGGIRSASYCLGVLQALANAKLLEKFDYLSTVSGGGYTGASISYLLHESSLHANDQAGNTAWPVFDATRENFPYLSNPMVDAPLADDPRTTSKKGELLRSLRENAKYLEPGRGITLLSLVGVVLRNGLVSLLVHVALLILVLQLAFYSYTTASSPGDIKSNWELLASAILFVVFGVMSAAYVLASSRFEHQPDLMRRELLCGPLA